MYLDDVLAPQEEIKPKRKAGRPTKEESLRIKEERKIALKKKKGKPTQLALANARGILGRPADVNGRIADLKARLLATSGDKVVNEIVRKALDPTDKDQIAALKMCIDRILPMSLFEKAKDARSQISINITGITDVTVDEEKEEVEDATIVDE